MERRVFLASTAAAALSPATLRAQQKAMPVIGFLGGETSGPLSSPYMSGFRQGLRETGYVEGQNLAIEYRWAEGRYDRLPALAADLVSRKVDVILAVAGDHVVSAAQGATQTIPIVFTSGSDPVRDGLVASMARPGGNLTGVSMLLIELNAKRFDLLSELLPQIRAVALMVNQNSPNTERIVQDMQHAASPRGVQVHILKASSDSEIDTAFGTLVQLHADALVVSADPFFTRRREQLVTLAARHAVPAIYTWREFATSGGLISYAPNIVDVGRQAGVYVGRILKGAKPADLPVVQPTTVELVVNMRTAKALGLTIPPSILARADEVIE